MDANVILTAHFEPIQDQFALNILVNPDGGGTTEPSIGTHTYANGEIVPITATPAAGYRFISWTGDVAEPGNATTTATVDGNITVTANFEIHLCCR